MGCCGCSNATAAAVAGALGLLQGLLWMVIGALGLLLYSCSITVEQGSNLFYVLYVLYFYNPECASAPVVDGSTVELSESTTERVYSTWVLSLAYICVNAVWALVSTMLLAVTCFRPGGVMVRLSCYLWSLGGAAAVALDVVATANFAFSITSDVAVLTGADESIQDEVRKLSVVGAVVLTLLSSRLVVLWLTNVVFVIMVTLGAGRLAEDFEDDKVMSTGDSRQVAQNGNGAQQPYLGYDPTDPRTTAFRKDQRLLPQVSLRSSPASSVSELPVIQRPFTYLPPQQQGRPVTYQQPAAQQPQELQRQQSVEDKPVSQRPFTYLPPQQGRPLTHHQTAAQQQQSVEKPTKNKKRRDKERARGKENVVHPEELPGYSILPLKKGFEPESPEPVQEDEEPEVELRLRSDDARQRFREQLEHQLENPRSKHALNALEDHVRRSDSTSRASVQRQPPEQLRSLLPWSYLAHPEDQPAVPRPSRDPDLEMPPVPVPDYTLHFGQRPRERVISNAGSSASSTGGSADSPVRRHRQPPHHVSKAVTNQEVLY